MQQTSHRRKIALERKKTVTVVLDRDLLELLQEACRQEERSLSQIVRRLLRSALETTSLPPPPSRLDKPP